MIMQSKISFRPPKAATFATGFRRALILCDFELNKFTTWGSWTPTHKTRNRKMCAFSHFTVPRSVVQRWGESLFFCAPQPCWHRWVFTNTSQKLTLPLKAKKKPTCHCGSWPIEICCLTFSQWVRGGPQPKSKHLPPDLHQRVSVSLLGHLWFGLLRPYITVSITFYLPLLLPRQKNAVTLCNDAILQET